MKIGICAWVLPCKEIDSFKLAKEFGISGVALNFGSVQTGSTFSKREVRDNYLHESCYNGVEIPTLNLNLLCEKGITRKENYSYGIEIFDQCLEIAVQMNIPKLQVPCFFDNQVLQEEDLDNTIEVLRYACKRAENHNILIGTENVYTIRQHEKLYGEINSQQLVSIFDTQNPWRMMNQDGVELAKYMIRYTYELHAKDSDPNGVSEIQLGEGDTRFNEIIRIFTQAKFDRWILLENKYKRMREFEKILTKDISILETLFEDKADLPDQNS